MARPAGSTWSSQDNQNMGEHRTTVLDNQGVFSSIVDPGKGDNFFLISNETLAKVDLAGRVTLLHATFFLDINRAKTSLSPYVEIGVGRTVIIITTTVLL